jgi:hypothetical protein
VTVPRRQLTRPAGLKLTRARANWRNVSNNNGYTLRVMRGSRQVFKVEVNRNQTRHNFTASQRRQLARAGRYTFTLVAKGRGNFTNSQRATSGALRIT